MWCNLGIENMQGEFRSYSYGNNSRFQIDGKMDMLTKDLSTNEYSLKQLNLHLHSKKRMIKKKALKVLQIQMKQIEIKQLQQLQQMQQLQQLQELQEQQQTQQLQQYNNVTNTIIIIATRQQ